MEYPEERTVKIEIERDNAIDIRASLYCWTGLPDDLEPGDIITADAEFSKPDNDYLYTYGIRLYAYTSEISVTKGSFSLRFTGAYSSNYVKTLISDIFPEDTFAFAKALITGDKDDFYEDNLLVTSFQSAGLSHIVAVSGMHLSFVLAIPGLFVKNRRRLSFISIPCILFFMAFAGFSPSVCRAGIMHICLSAANLFRRESDDYTSLFAAVFIILLADPYAAASVSLQLSFTSVLGIMMFTEKIYNALMKPAVKFPKIIRALYRTIITLFAASIGALIFTTPLTALYFGQVSVIAPLVSIFVLSILSFTFCLCILSCVLGAVFPPAGVVAAQISSLFLRYIMWVARTAADSPVSSIYTANTAAVIWLILTYLIFIVVFLMKRPAKAYIVPGCFSVIGLCLLLLLPKFPSADTSLNMAVLDVGQGQCIVVTSGTMTAVIDCGSTSGEDAGDIAADYLHSKGIDTIDILILTHYHADHVNGVTDLLSVIDVTTLFLPPMEDYSTYDDEIVAIAEERGGNIICVDDNFIAHMGETQLYIYPPVVSSGENEKCNAILCSNGDYDILVTGDMPAYCELLLLDYADIPDIEVLIAGHHGSADSSCDSFLKAVSPETAVISVGKNSYGHPAEETLDRFEEYGITVFRTDISGNIILD